MNLLYGFSGRPARFSDTKGARSGELIEALKKEAAMQQNNGMMNLLYGFSGRPARFTDTKGARSGELIEALKKEAAMQQNNGMMNLLYGFPGRMAARSTGDECRFDEDCG